MVARPGGRAIWPRAVQDYRDLESDPQLEHLGVFKSAVGAGGVRSGWSCIPRDMMAERRR